MQKAWQIWNTDGLDFKRFCCDCVDETCEFMDIFAHTHIHMCWWFQGGLFQVSMIALRLDLSHNVAWCQSASFALNSIFLQHVGLKLKCNIVCPKELERVAAMDTAHCDFGYVNGPENVCIPIWVPILFHLSFVSLIGWICAFLREALLCLCRWWHRNPRFADTGSTLELEDQRDVYSEMRAM